MYITHSWDYWQMRLLAGSDLILTEWFQTMLQDPKATPCEFVQGQLHWTMINVKLLVSDLSSQRHILASYFMAQKLWLNLPSAHEAIWLLMLGWYTIPLELGTWMKNKYLNIIIIHIPRGCTQLFLDKLNRSMGKIVLDKSLGYFRRNRLAMKMKDELHRRLWCGFVPLQGLWST